MGTTKTIVVVAIVFFGLFFTLSTLGLIWMDTYKQVLQQGGWWAIYTVFIGWWVAALVGNDYWETYHATATK